MKAIPFFRVLFSVILLTVAYSQTTLTAQNPGLINQGALMIHSLPFTENWEQGAFSLNNWTHDTKWKIDSTGGNPGHCAVFTWDPVVYNYSQVLESDTIDGTDSQCLGVWFDFDYKLTVTNSSGNEYLAVELFYDSAWHQRIQFRNLSPSEWSAQHLNISMVKGKVFKVRFRAYGLNSSDVYRWSVDNINIFGLCPAPRNLFAYGPACSTNGALLSWNSPETQGSYSGNLLYEGFENGTFPPLYFTQNITNTTANNTSWSQSNASGTWGIHSGTGCCGLAYDFAHQDEWLIAHNILVTGNLSFWSHGYQGSLYLDHYYVKVSTNNGTTWSVLMDLSALSPAGWNNWNTPYVINLSDYFGMAVDIAWQAVDGDGGGLWYDWAIDDCSIGSKKITFGEYKNQLNTEEVIGYDIYRRKYNESAFIKINTQIVTDTTYCDPNVNSYLAYYFVTALFDTSNCIGSCTSDTVVPIWIGIPEKNENSIRVYPNPANDVLSVSCDNPVEHCELINLYGKSVYALREIRNRSFVIRIEEIPPGIYFINVTTSSGVGREKVVICH